MDKAIKAAKYPMPSETRDRLENDPVFSRTTELMIAEILDKAAESTNASAKGHTLRISGQLLKPHIDSLKISIIDSYKAGNLNNYLIFHNSFRRMFEIGIETVHGDNIVQRMEDFSQRRQRVEAI